VTTVTIEGFNPFAGAPLPPAPEPLAGSYATLPFYPALRACTACTARPEAKQVVGGAGPVGARILVVGQNPGEEEDSAGVPFIGNAGDEFNSWLVLLGLDRAKLVVTNIVKCHTTKNRVPRPKEVRTCADLWLSEELQQLAQVDVLLPLGKPAVVGVLGKDAPPMTPIMVHHYRVRVWGRELRVFPLPHPAYLLRARHLAPMFRETILSQLKLTLLQEVPEAYAQSALV
jgi:uracil-DNA glycosylase family 4